MSGKLLVKERIMYVLFTILRDPELFGSSDSVDIIGTTRRGEEHAIMLAQNFTRETSLDVTIVKATDLDDEAADEAALMVDLIDEVMEVIHHDPNARAFAEAYYYLPKAAIVAALAVTWTYAGDYTSPKVALLRKVAWAIQEGMDTTDSPWRNQALAAAELIRRLMAVDYDEQPELFESLLEEIGQIVQSCM
jgi:hypothetical protein